MYKSDTSGTGCSGGGTQDECCADAACASGQRNNYYEGKRLTPDSFRVEQHYLVERRRLLNRAMFGWGVVYGYAVQADSPQDDRVPKTYRKLRIDSGLALDACGRELLQVGTAHVRLDDVIIVDEKGKRLDPKKAFAADPQACWRLDVHYAERSTDPVTVGDACRCDRDEWDRVCETVRYSLRRIDCEACCVEPPCELECDCGLCCEPASKADPKDPKYPKDPGRPVVVHDPESPKNPNDPRGPRPGLAFEDLWRPLERPHGRGGCRCLCDHLMKLDPGADCDGRLCDIDDCCGHVEVDLLHGVPLACVRVVWDSTCGEWAFSADVDPCGPRRLVKRNDLLFDLIRGCDLTRIIEIGWAPWHRQEVSFEEFMAGFGDIGHDKPSYVTKQFFVKFSRPVRESTLRADCFTMNVMFVEGEGGWWWSRRVPIIGVDTSLVPAEQGDPPNHVRGVRLVVDGPWADDAICGTKHLFQGGPAIVEIQIRGDFIIDCNGQAIDADAIGPWTDRTGNGAPGGTFTSSFRVQQALPSSQGTYDAGERPKGAQS